MLQHNSNSSASSASFLSSILDACCPVAAQPAPKQEAQPAPAPKASKPRNSKAHSKASKAHSNGKQEAQPKAAPKQEAQPTLPDTLPERCNACIGKEGAKQDATTALIFQYHIRKALAAYGGTASICQIYNYLRGDSPLRLEQDGSPKQDGLPRWAGLGNSKLFRNYTEGTLLTYTHKPTSNGRIRSVALAGPMLPEFPAM